MLGVDHAVVVSLGETLRSKISVVANSARDALVEQENFIQLACYLERILPITIELQKGRDSSPMVCEILRALLHDVECAQRLIENCSDKSRIYLVTHSTSIARQLEDVVHDLGRSLSIIPVSSVQGHEDTKSVIDSLSRDMQQAHFDVKETDGRICELLLGGSVLQNDPNLQTGLFLDIVHSLGIEDAPGNLSSLKYQVELLKNDLQGTTEAYDLQMMHILGNMVDNWAQYHVPGNQQVESIHHVELKRVEPLYDSFICPLTKQVMHDPVTLEDGQTYERTAIEHWFRECKEKGKPPMCPMTGKELKSTVMSPSIALRNTIEEWMGRNEGARIDNVRISLSANSSEQKMLRDLKDLQVLCLRNEINKQRVRTTGLIPIIVECLKGGEQVRCTVLSILRILAEDDDDNKEAIGETDAIQSCVKYLTRKLSKEREEAVFLLFELSKYYPLCEKIGTINGAILMLVGLAGSHSENVTTVQMADQTLENLEKCDLNVKQMAENGRLQPLLKRLVEGGEEVQFEMSSYLTEVVLSTEGKRFVAEFGAKTLVGMLKSRFLTLREAAIKGLCQLSTLRSNGKILVEAGILPPLIRDLFMVGFNQLPLKLKEVSATILANVVSSGAHIESISIDEDGNTLTSEFIVHNLLHLISNTGPTIESKLLQVLVGLASSPGAVGNVVSSIKSAGAMISLIQFLEAPQKELRVNSAKLLHDLCPYMGQEIADGLRITTGQLGTLVKLLGTRGVTEEQAAAAGLLANLPTLDVHLTRALLEKGAFPIALRKLMELQQGTTQIATGRFVGPLTEGLVGILSRCTYVMDDSRVIALAKEYNLTALFTNLLSTGGLDEVQRISALALRNLSACSKQFSRSPEITIKANSCLNLRLFFKTSIKSVDLCPLHGGDCSTESNFCLLEAGAVVPLVACLDHMNVSVVEAAIGAISTLIQDSVDIERGIQILSNAGAIQPILDTMREHRTEVLRQQAVWMVERVLRDGDMARVIASNANVHTALVEAFRYGNYDTRQMAERALKHLDKIPNISGVFHTT